MQPLFAAQDRLKECKAREAELEVTLMSLLEGSHSKAQVEEVEEELKCAQAAIAEAYAVVVYYQSRGGSGSTTLLDLYRTVFHSHHPAALPRWSNDEWMSHTMRWSESNAKHGITGLLMTTKDVHFGVLEGSFADIQACMKKIENDPRHAQFTVLSTGKVESREFLFGLKLHIVEDDILAMVLARAQQDIVQSSCYAPQPAMDVVCRGGDPEGVVPEHRPESIVVAVILDSQIGAHHSGEAYVAAATTIDALCHQHGGVAVERFGESMVLVFPLSHGTQAVTATRDIIQRVPFAIAAIATGPVTMISAPHCWALGQGLIEAKQLVYAAEQDRRALAVTPKAMERCSKAHHKFLNFTINAQPLFTLQSIGDARLGLEQEEEDIIPQHTGMVAVVVAESNVTQYRPMTHHELIESRQAAAVVRGALTKDRALQTYRELDPGNVGWVSKDTVKQWLLGPNTPYPLFDEREWKQLTTWLLKQNTVGPKLLNFEEFSALLFKLEQR